MQHLSMPEDEAPANDEVTLPQIKMEAHRGPYIEDSGLKGPPLYFQFNLQECRSVES